MLGAALAWGRRRKGLAVFSDSIDVRNITRTRYLDSALGLWMDFDAVLSSQRGVRMGSSGIEAGTNKDIYI